MRDTTKAWTVPYLKGLKPRKDLVKYRISENTERRNTGRLMFEVLGSGHKSFYFKYFFDGKRRFVRIGSFKESNLTPGYTLAEARTIRDEYSKFVVDGEDVKTYVEQEKEGRKLRAKEYETNRQLGTFAQMLDSYIAYMKANDKRSYKSVDSSLTTYVRNPFPYLIKAIANSISQDDIGDIIGRMINNGITAHSNRVRSFLHAAFNHGIKQDNSPKKYLPEKPKFKILINPVSNIERQGEFEKVREHELTPDEIVIVWNELLEDYPSAGFLMRLTLSTCQRHGELSRMKWSDVYLNKGEFLMPKSLTKNKRDHVVPINGIANTAFKDLHKITGDYEYLFPAKNVRGFINDKCICITSINKQVRKFLKGREDIRPFQCKDTRGTVKTLMGQIGISKEMRDRIQNHALTDVSTKHYDRYDYMTEKRQAMNKWNRKLGSIIKGEVAKAVQITR